MMPQRIAAWIQTVAHGPFTLMLTLNLILLISGTDMDGARHKGHRANRSRRTPPAKR